MSSAAKFKFIFLGDEFVGKTSIIQRFASNSFEEAYVNTIGMDLIPKKITVDDKPVRLQLWDTAGQERFRALIPGYFRDADVAVIVYDVVNRKSFDETASWAEEVRRERGDEVILALVGNKVDLTDLRQVSQEEGQQKAESLQATFFEASARSGEGVREMFTDMARKLLGQSSEQTLAGEGSEPPRRASQSHTLGELPPQEPISRTCAC